jgi:hypothetical protein
MVMIFTYDYFTMEHFRLRQRMTLRPKFIARDCTLCCGLTDLSAGMQE